MPTSSFLAELGGLDARISATRSLPPLEQEEALVALFQATDHGGIAPFVALLIGEVVALREVTAPRRKSHPLPSPAAASAPV